MSCHVPGSAMTSITEFHPRFLIFLWSVVIPPFAFAQEPPPQYNDHTNLSVLIDSEGTPVPIRTTEDWIRRRHHVLESMQQVMGRLPNRTGLTEPDVKETAIVEGDGYVRRTISFSTLDDERVPADLYLPTSQTTERRPAMLALHPTGRLGKRIVAGEGPLPNRQYAVELAQRGYVVIAPDYPSFGDYPCDFSSTHFQSGTMKGIYNHMRCVDLLGSLDSVDPNRIGVIGHSLGGHNAIFVAAFDERLKVVVSSCGWTPFHNYYGGKKLANWAQPRYMPLVAARYQNDPGKLPFDFPEVVAALAPRAFFSNSPVHDANFDVTGVRKAMPEIEVVFDLFDSGDSLQLRTPPAEHDFPTEIRSDAYAFLDKHLDHRPSRALDFSGELPRYPPLEPDAALAAFEVTDGFQIDRVASEPLVADPVAMAFDELGLLYVVQMRGYSEQRDEFLGEIRVLEDTDGDGNFDTSQLVEGNLSWPTAITCFDGGVFVAAAPDLWYLKDTDGDRKADVRTKVFTGFGRGNVQGLVNSLRWGVDNRIHGAASSSGGEITRPDDPTFRSVTLRRCDFSFDPRGLDLRVESGGAQHGMCFDKWGRKFCSSNSDHIQYVVYDDRYVARNKSLSAPSARISIATDGPQAPVFRSSPVEPWRIVRTRLRASKLVSGPVEGGGTPAGYFTGATGVTIYHGHASPELDGLAFVADVGSNLIHRKRLSANGVEMSASRIDEASEFVRSTDTWFRPVQFANAPDGGLYVLDMYREVIEHPKSLPPEIKKHVDLTSGRDRGRLYRILPSDFQQPEIEWPGEVSDENLVEMLDHANGWHRTTAARLIFERGSDFTNRLVASIHKGQRAEARILAMHALGSKKLLNPGLLLQAVQDQHPRVREHAIRLFESFGASGEKLPYLLTEDSDPGVRLQLAFSAGEFQTTNRLRVITQLLKSDGGNLWIRTAALSSLNTEAHTVLESLTPFCETNDDALAAVEDLVLLIGRQKNEKGMRSALHCLSEMTNISLQSRLLIRFATSSGEAARLAMTQRDNDLMESVLSWSRHTILDKSASLEARTQAARALRFGSFAVDAEKLFQALEPDSPPAVQAASLRSLAGFQDTDFTGVTGARLIHRWRTMSPGLRSEAITQWTARDASGFLSAVEAGKISRTDVPSTTWLSLQQDRDARIRTRASSIHSASTLADRRAVLEKYQPAVQLDGNVNEGRTIFRRLCSTCHRLEGHGHDVGASLATVANQGRATMLLNILDPNREVNPRYSGYVIVTNDGRTHSGIMTSESSTTVTLKQPGGITSEILRASIDELSGTGVSLMPVGLEKQLTTQAMADLLSYLSVIR